MAILLVAGAARADESTAQVVRRVGQSAWKKTERALAIGPTVGLGGSCSFHSTGYDVPMSLGLELTWFDVPLLPDPADIYEQTMERAKAKAAARAQQMIFEGKPAPTRAEMDAWVREMFEEVKAEVMASLDYQPHLVEDPSFRIATEAAYLPEAGQWQVRLTGGIGLGPVSVGPTALVHVGDGTGVAVGGEVDLHLMPSDSARSPVIDLYVRADIGIRDDSAAADQIGLGARFLLDVF